VLYAGCDARQITSKYFSYRLPGDGPFVLVKTYINLSSLWISIVATGFWHKNNFKTWQGRVCSMLMMYQGSIKEVISN